MAILDDFKLEGRVALVTGGGRGLGQGLAVGLAEAGADVAVLDVVSLDETREQVSGLGRRCQALRYDLGDTDTEFAAEIVSECVSELGASNIWEKTQASFAGRRRSGSGEGNGREE